MDGSDRIMSILCTDRAILASRAYYLCTGKPISKDIENIKEIIEEFEVFKEVFGKMNSYVT